MRTRKPGLVKRHLHFSRLLIFFLVFLGLVLFAEKTGVETKWLPSSASEAPKTITIKRSIVVYVTPTPTPFQWTVSKVDEHETAMSIPADPRMSTADELFTAMNTYRQANGVNTIQKTDSLCSIAQNRANEQVANGKLDAHAGFDKYVQGQNEFPEMGEVLFGGSQPLYGVHIVEFGWNRSLTGHREVIQDKNWNYGCGGVAGYYAVFIFGHK